jgi:hypothetical protein
MGRSQWVVLSMLSIYSVPSHQFHLPLPVYPPAQVLQIAERFYQTLLPLIIARGIAKQRKRQRKHVVDRLNPQPV